jgi:hypothetical protein
MLYIILRSYLYSDYNIVIYWLLKLKLKYYINADVGLNNGLLNFIQVLIACVELSLL